MTELEIQCPACFETFCVPAPARDELPADLDYDCEICCRPMVIEIVLIDGEVSAQARSLSD